MSKDIDKKDRSLGLSTAQVAGSALAAMSGAFFASWAGTAGTLMGAAAGSVIATVGAATYTWSLRRTSDAAKRTAALVKQRSLVTGSMPSTMAQGPLREDGSDASVFAGETDLPPSAVEEPPEIDTGSRRLDLPWAKLAVVCLAVMVIAMAGITAIELVTGKPVSAVLGKDSNGTTVGHVVGRDPKTSTDDTPAPNKDGTTPTPKDSEPSSEPKPSTGPQQPVPSTEPTTVPSGTPAPVQSAAPDTTGQ